MKQVAPTNHEFEFYFPRLDTHVRVEETDGAVIIRASRNTFSPQRKASFIHELAAEGFIDDRHLWSNGSEPLSGITWVRDISWLKLHPAVLAVSRRFMLRLFGWAIVLWLALMMVVLWR